MAEISAGRTVFLREMGQLGIDVSRETVDRLETLVATLVRWQKAINLVSGATVADVWVRHVLDSGQVAPLLPAGTASLVDLGSGAGFPGLVLAALRPDLDIALLEADTRKAAFLVEAARQMNLPKQPRVLQGRLEKMAPAKAGIVAARALAPLSQLLPWADRYRTDTAICLFHKGKGWQGELREAMKDWDIPYQSFTSVTDRDAVILRIGKYVPTSVRHRQPKGWRGEDDHGD